MDDTQKSRSSDVNSTRKRRSSILKSQRPPRTPFSELEFNVATPTDTVKSRRVSFSRRTGVAEFVTNEATTTWKNFYEEHNKSLESSGNDSQVKASRQQIGHIGKRIFDEQFEEVEAVDFLRQLNNPALNINTSINNINVTQQLALLENTDSIKLSVPHTNFELSTFTENHSKLFGNEFTAPTMGEMSEHIDVNFSDIQSIDQQKDDLDEIQRDLERVQNNVNYIGPFADRQNLSEYIEIDLNTTHITMGNEQSDMSITDTIHSQVQDVSKNCSIDKKMSQSQDWVTDKENIAINPYVAPRESVNFAINEEADKVLVFDGKRLTLQSERDDKNSQKTQLTSGPTMDTPQRKTIVLNVNDDLPNFIDDLHISNIDLLKGIAPKDCEKDLTHMINRNVSTIDHEPIPMREAVLPQNMPDKKCDSDVSRTQYENDTCNISVTQTLPANIIQNKIEISQSVLDANDCNMSVTQAVPMNIVVLNCSNSGKRRTIVFEDDVANISMTQALPVNIIHENLQNRKTILNEDNDTMAGDMPQNVFPDNNKLNNNVNPDMPFTYGNPSNILDNSKKCDKERLDIFGNDTLNILVTQAIPNPNNVIVNEKSSLPARIKTVLPGNDRMVNISDSEAITNNIILPEKSNQIQKSGDTLCNYATSRNTLVQNLSHSKKTIYDNNTGNILVTQVVSSNTTPEDNEGLTQRRKDIVCKNYTENISVTQTIPSNNILSDNETQTQRRRTIVYDNDAGNLSVTQAIPSHIILPNNEAQAQRRRTIVYDNDAGDISVTQAIPSNIILPDNEVQAPRRRTIVYDNDAGNISVTQAIPSNIILPDNEAQAQRRRTIVYDNDAGNLSVTQAIPSNIILPNNEAQAQRRRTIVYDNDAGDISATQAIKSNIILPDNEAQAQRRRTIVYDNDAGNLSVTQAIPSNIILPNNEAQAQRRRTIVYDNDAGNISVTQAIPSNIILPNDEVQAQRRRTIVYDNDAGNISVTQAIPSNIILPDNEVQAPRRRTIVYDNDAGNISVTQAIPSNIILPNDEVQSQRRRTIVYDNDAGNISVTQAIPSNIILPDNEVQAPRRRTIVYDNDAGNISVTQAIPSNIILPNDEVQSQRRRTIVYDNDAGNISVTQAIPSNIILPDNEVQAPRRRTIVYDNDAGNISVTQAIPSKIVLSGVELSQRRTVAYENGAENITFSEAIPSNIMLLANEAQTQRRSTIDISHCISRNSIMTDEVDLLVDQSLSNNIPTSKPIMETTNNNVSRINPPEVIDTPKIYMRNEQDDKQSGNKSTYGNKNNKETLGRGKESPDIEMTSTALDNLRPYWKKRDSKEFHDNCEGMIIEVMPSENLVKQSIIHDLEIKSEGKHDKTINNTNLHDVSATKEVVNQLPNAKNDNCSIILSKESKSIQLETAKRMNTTVEDHIRKTTITKPIPNTLSSIQNECMEKSLTGYSKNSESNPINRQVLLYQVTTKESDLLETKTTDQSRCEKAKDDEITLLSSSKIIVATDNIDITKSPVLVKRDSEFSYKKTIHSNDIIFDEHKIDIVKSTSIQKTSEKSKVALDGLLNVSNGSVESGKDEKNLKAKSVCEHQLLEDNKKEDIDNISAESMFYITKDSDEENQSDEEMNQNVSQPSCLNKKEENLDSVDCLQKNLDELKSVIKESMVSPPKNRHYEKIISFGEATEKNIESSSHMLNSIKKRKSFKTADDTDYLLQMLSDLTENKVSDIIEDDEKPESIMGEEHLVLKNKTVDIETKQKSIDPKQQPIALNREDMLNNISMARAALQKSRLELDESENFENIEKDSSAEQESPRKNTVRMSNEVVKTLHFEEDDTASETSIKSDKISPLKKTAFGETSYMKERKAKVIPSYLKDVSDGIKALMHDLVKPTADTIPFEAVGLDKSLKKNASTCSTEIQANLMTSSQIDLNTELYSNPTSVYDFKTRAGLINELTENNTANSSSPKKNIESVMPSEDNLNRMCTRQNQLLKTQTMAEEILVFDHENPLNNVFLASVGCTNAHRYNPIASDEPMHGQSCFSKISKNDKDIELERISMQYNVDSRGVSPHLPTQSNDVCEESITGVQSITSTTSKPMSIDQSTDVRMVEMKHIDINTSITMKGNKDLLEATSSLTLVDDALAQNVFDLDIDTNTSASHNSLTATKPQSPVKVIYQSDECGVNTEKHDSDFTSADEITEIKEHKRKKRNYSSTKHKNPSLSELDATPKPTSKVQKMSNSPKNIFQTMSDLHRVSPEQNKFTSNRIESRPDEEMLSPGKTYTKSPRKSRDKTGTTITVQRLITEYHIETSMDQKTLNKQTVEAVTDQAEKAKVNLNEASSVEPVCSFTSSKNVQERDDISISTDSRPISVCSDKSAKCVNWQTDLVNDVDSKKSTSECESSVNVVTKINMLPFMGSEECEWEWSSGDTWSFRLLHARLRLVLRLAHRQHNATSASVRADTPVVSVNVEIAQHDKKNPVASTCVRFAAETMRYFCAQGCARAGAVPALVRRCAAAARLAARWARAMHHARAHLAYTLSDDGLLALKVANIPLRSVWEVTMRLELVVEEGGGAPWPRAGAVRVCRAVCERGAPPAPAAALRAHLAHLAPAPADWGHAPRTLWRIFKYLKNKTRDDELLAA